MNSRSKLLLALILGTTISGVPAMAQATNPDQTNNPNATAPNTPGQPGQPNGADNTAHNYGVPGVPTDTGHHGFDWGWLGLLGLIGLAGRRRGAATGAYDQTTTRDYRTGRDRAA
jgi:MYXO-CTERM domain-containing protein